MGCSTNAITHLIAMAQRAGLDIGLSDFENYSRRVPVIGMTDGPLSPLVESCRVWFELPDDSSRPFRSLVAPMCLAQALVMSTGHHLAEKPAPRVARKAKP